jgi:hypothetical protein
MILAVVAPVGPDGLVAVRCLPRRADCRPCGDHRGSRSWSPKIAGEIIRQQAVAEESGALAGRGGGALTDAATRWPRRVSVQSGPAIWWPASLGVQTAPATRWPRSSGVRTTPATGWRSSSGVRIEVATLVSPTRSTTFLRRPLIRVPFSGDEISAWWSGRSQRPELDPPASTGPAEAARLSAARWDAGSIRPAAHSANRDDRTSRQHPTTAVRSDRTLRSRPSSTKPGDRTVTHRGPSAKAAGASARGRPTSANPYRTGPPARRIPSHSTDTRTPVLDDSPQAHDRTLLRSRHEPKQGDRTTVRTPAA